MCRILTLSFLPAPIFNLFFYFLRQAGQAAWPSSCNTRKEDAIKNNHPKEEIWPDELILSFNKGLKGT